MTVLVLDSGALIAVDRGDRRAILDLWLEHRHQRRMVTHPMVVAQVWRGGRQAMLARFLKGVDVRSIDDAIGRRCGELLATAGASDPVDAAVVVLARNGDHIVTSDPHDITQLVEASGRAVRVVPV